MAVHATLHDMSGARCSREEVLDHMAAGDRKAYTCTFSVMSEARC